MIARSRPAWTQKEVRAQLDAQISEYGGEISFIRGWEVRRGKIRICFFTSSEISGEKNKSLGFRLLKVLTLRVVSSAVMKYFQPTIFFVRRINTKKLTIPEVDKLLDWKNCCYDLILKRDNAGDLFPPSRASLFFTIEFSFPCKCIFGFTLHRQTDCFSLPRLWEDKSWRGKYLET